MAVTHWITGAASETTASVLVRADSTGDVAVVANGQTVQAACNTAVNDGNALATITGLSPGQTYAYTVGGVVGGNLRTLPASAPYWVALSSCWAPNSTDTLAMRLLQAPAAGADKALHAEMVANLRAFFCLGDLVYMNTTGTVNGYPLVNVDGGSMADSKNLEYRRNYYRATRLNGGIKSLFRNVPTYFLKDDHEYDPDNACNDLAWYQTKFGGATQGDLDEMWTAADTAWKDWTLGNPASELVGPSCFRVRIGPVEFFATDQIYSRTYHGTVDSATKYMMSPAQEEWLLSAMASSPATFKVWLSSKQFVSSCGRNSDGWCNIGGFGKGYETQLTRILTDSRFPRAGSLSVTGDEHIRSDLWVSSSHFGSHAAISQISAGPATIEVITDPNDGLTYRSGVRDKERDTSGQERRGENNYLLLRVLADRVERYVLGSRYGLRYMGYVGTADNVVRR